MKKSIQWVRSVIYLGVIYFNLMVVGIVFLPWALVSRSGAFAAAHTWCRSTMWLAGWMVGIKTEVRGTPPTGEVLVAAKHQSFLDIIMIYASLPRGKFIMKKELIYTPVIGIYGLRMGCVPVDRGKRGAAIKKMVAQVVAGIGNPGQLIIFAQGTRVPPTEKLPYKIGAGILYKELKQDCVPVAVNVGAFWPAHGIMRTPGTAVIEFLPTIPAGKSLSDFMEELENVVETRSEELLVESGYYDRQK